MTAIHPQIQAIADRRVLAAGDEEPGPAGAGGAARRLPAAPRSSSAERSSRSPTSRTSCSRAPTAAACRRASYRPLAPGPHGGLLVWCHGGGWVMGDLEGFDRVARQLANACGVPCVSVDYRLAPEHPFPAAVDDAQAAIEWALRRRRRAARQRPGARRGRRRQRRRPSSRRSRSAARARPRSRSCWSIRRSTRHATAMPIAPTPTARCSTRADMRACWEAYLARPRCR